MSDALRIIHLCPSSKYTIVGTLAYEVAGSMVGLFAKWRSNAKLRATPSLKVEQLTSKSRRKEVKTLIFLKLMLCFVVIDLRVILPTNKV